MAANLSAARDAIDDNMPARLWRQRQRALARGIVGASEDEPIISEPNLPFCAFHPELVVSEPLQCVLRRSLARVRTRREHRDNRGEPKRAADPNGHFPFRTSHDWSLGLTGASRAPPRPSSPRRAALDYTGLYIYFGCVFILESVVKKKVHRSVHYEASRTQ